MEEQKPESELKLDRIKYLNDKLKTTAFTTHINKMTPPMSESQESPSAVVQAIHGRQYTKDVKFLELLGYEENPITGNWMQLNEPVMNMKGISKMMRVLRSITETIEFSNLHEDFVNPFAATIIKETIIDYDLSPQDYDLDEDDLGDIFVELLVYTVASANKAKNAGHRNVIRNAMSEESIRKVMSEPVKNKGIFGGKVNNFGGNL